MFGPRIPSLTKRIAARLSVKRAIRHRLGFKAPRGWGWLTNPRRAAYNRLYYRIHRSGLAVVTGLVRLSWAIGVAVVVITAAVGEIGAEIDGVGAIGHSGPDRIERTGRGEEFGH